jgi:hypothetical protein
MGWYEYHAACVCPGVAPSQSGAASRPAFTPAALPGMDGYVATVQVRGLPRGRNVLFAGARSGPKTLPEVPGFG